MAYEKRLYITKVIKVPTNIGDEIVDMQVPYLSSLPQNPKDPEDPYHWDAIYDDKGDPDGATPGIHDHCIVAVFADTPEHDILESDPEIVRIDDL